MKSFKKCLISSLVLLNSALVFAGPGETEYDSKLHKEFSHESQGLIKKTYFSVFLDANTKIQISEFNAQNEKVTFKMKIKVTCGVHAHQGLTENPEKMAPWDISEKFCVETTGPSILVEADAPNDFSAEEKEDVIYSAIDAAIEQEPRSLGTGLNLGTGPAQLIEVLCPGVQGAFVRNLTCMAFTDRKEEIARATARFVKSLF